MKYGKNIIHIVLTLAIFLLLAAGHRHPAFGNSTPKATDEALVNQESPEQVAKGANELLVRIERVNDEAERYESALDAASGEDRLVLLLQINRLQKRIMADIHQLVETLLFLEKSGKQAELRKQVERLCQDALPSLWSQVSRLRGEIDTVRARRLDAAPEDRLAIENEIAYHARSLDPLYGISLVCINDMQRLDMAVEKERAEFTKLLSDRFVELFGRMELALYRIKDLEEQANETPEDAIVPKLMKAAEKGLDTNADSMAVVMEHMDTLGLDTKAGQTILVVATKDISSELISTGILVRLMNRIINKVTGWFVEKGPQIFVKLLLFLVIIYVFRIFKRLVRAGLEKSLQKSKLNLSQLAHRFIVSTVSNTVMVFGILVALSQLGIRLGPLLTGLGVAGFIVGFALQDSLSNFAAGVMILLYRPYDMGDLVDVGGVFGKVHKMSLVSTSLLTLDNQMFVVPNTKIWGDVIKNVTAQEVRRVDLVFGISYSDDIPKAESILEDILKSHDGVLDDPEPLVRLDTLGASSVDFVVRPWVKIDDYWDVYWDVTRSVKLRFDKEGISIPFPQRDVHVYNETPAAISS